MSDMIVNVTGLNKSFGNKQVLKDISFTCKSGSIVGLLGPNGSGKTTLIKILTGLITGYEGDVRIDGEPIGVKTKATVSFLPDEPYFADWMRAKDALTIFTDLYHDFDYMRCLEIMQRFRIDADMRIKTMSKGTKEKFQLALVMSRHSKLIVLDEPIGGVDPAAREVILDTILSNYREDQTILIATHLIADIERIFDSVLFIKEGKIVLDDNVEEIRSKTQKSIDELFREEFKY